MLVQVKKLKPAQKQRKVLPINEMLWHASGYTHHGKRRLRRLVALCFLIIILNIALLIMPDTPSVPFSECCVLIFLLASAYLIYLPAALKHTRIEIYRTHIERYGHFTCMLPKSHWFRISYCDLELVELRSRLYGTTLVLETYDEHFELPVSHALHAYSLIMHWRSLT